jgi:hypothetical protein
MPAKGSAIHICPGRPASRRGCASGRGTGSRSTCSGPVGAPTEKRRIGPEETLVVVRERQGRTWHEVTSTGGRALTTWEHRYFLSNAAAGMPPAELAYVISAEHRIEECLERAKGEAGRGRDDGSTSRSVGEAHAVAVWTAVPSGECARRRKLSRRAAALPRSRTPPVSRAPEAATTRRRSTRKHK